MSEITEWLARVKSRKVIPLPSEVEDLKAIAARVDTPKRCAEIKHEHYMDVIGRNGTVLRLPLHAVTHDSQWKTSRLWWIDFESKRCYGAKLSDIELVDLADIWRCEQLLTRLKRPVKVRGYGPFPVSAFAGGEEVVDEKSERFVVCESQTQPGWVELWAHADSLHARRIVFRPDWLVFALTPEVAARAKRRARRQRNPA